MQVITTHLSADFDCLASMMAARKLYPDARMVFPGSAERTVHEYLKGPGSMVEISRIKDIDMEKVSLLILVDTHFPKRIGVFQSLLDKPDVEVHIFDHHPEAAEEVRGDRVHIKKRGATTTILFEMLSEKSIALTPEESTLMALGIYQDTHSLMSPNTTPEDMAAASNLLKMGADLNVVAEYVHPRLGKEQLTVLNEMIANLESKNVNGVDVTWTTASLEHYVDDLAYVAHKVMDLENLTVLMSLVRLDRRVYLIARSRTEEVNCLDVAQSFGGGGHPNAASASIRDMTLVQAHENLIRVLHDKIHPLYLVKDIMHRQAISVEEKDSVQSVEKILTRFNLNTLPVLVENRPIGLITRQIVEKALHHGMNREPVGDFMNREFSVTTPDAFFKTIVPVVIEEKQKLVPVVDPDGNLAGIVSRGDLLRVLHGDMASRENGTIPLFEGKSGIHKNIKSLMKERLPKNLMGLLESIGGIADQAGVSVSVVGGFVRDVLLNIENLDIDIVVEGEGIQFAELLGKKLHGRVKSHAKFGTSVIILEDGFRIDVATARMEYYKHPAALPSVEKSSIKSDLFRRDFTVNSLAVKLNGKEAFCLIDYFNGGRDLKDKMVRVLHNLSFIEDPCRIFRAIRFEQRFGFSIGKQTESFMKNAIQKNMVNQLSGPRFLNELKLILKEKDPMKCIRRMEEFSLFRFISPKMLQDPESMETLVRLERVLSWSNMVPFPKAPEVWSIYFLGLFFSLDNGAFNRAAERLHLPMRLKARLQADRENCRKALVGLKGNREFAPSEIYDLFSAFSSEAVIFMLAASNSDRANRYATLFFTQYHDSAELLLTGTDLIRMGMEPGPIFQAVFQALREARVNGEVKSRDDEMALVEEQFLKDN